MNPRLLSFITAATLSTSGIAAPVVYKIGREKSSDRGVG